MPPDQNQNINLLPGDLQRKREVIKKVIASDVVEYTQPQNGQTTKLQPNFLNQTRPVIKPLPKKEPAKKPEPKPEPKKEPKESWWRKIKAAPVPVAPKKEEPKPVAPKEPVNLDVNLLSEEYAEIFKVRNQKSIFITWAVIAAAVIIFAYLGIYLYQIKKSAAIRQTSQINAELEKTIATYSGLEQEDALLLQKISSLKTLLGNHVSLSNFLRLLEAVTTPEVTYTALAASREGLVTITALATDYTALARQLSILQEHTEWVRDAQVTSAQLSKDNQAKSRGVEFDLLLKVDQSVFSETEKIAP